MSVSDNEMMLMEFTGIGATEAKNLLEAFNGDVNGAAAHYFENPGAFGSTGTGGRPPPVTSADDNDLGGTLDTAPPLAMVATQTGASGGSDVKYVCQSCNTGPPVILTAHMAHMGCIELSGLHGDDTIATLKTFIAAETKVPTVVQVILYKGKMLGNGKATLRELGFLKDPRPEVAVLFPERDERGVVHVVKTNVDGTKTKLFDLAEGEWSVSTSIRAVRKRAMDILKHPPGTWIAVHNALHMEDASTFGQNGIHKGSTISFLDDSSNRKDITKHR